MIRATKQADQPRRARRSPGVFRADEAYTVSEFRRRADLGSTAWRDVRKRLRVVTIGRKQYVLGADWIRFLESEAASATEANGATTDNQSACEQGKRNGSRG